MSDKQQFFIRSDSIRANACQYVASIVPDNDRPMVVEVKPITRTLEQSAKFHAMCGEVSRKLTYMGRVLTQEQWKVLFISGHAIATNQPCDVIPGIEGEFCNIRESSARMGVMRMSSLIEYVYAYAIGQGVKFSADAR